MIFILLGVISNAQTSGFSGTGANIDVVYHRCNWRINPDSVVARAIKGSVTTYFVTKAAGVKIITFDLRKSAFDNPNLSVSYHGSPVTFSFPSSGAVNILSIDLGATLPINTLDSVTIFYGGSAPAVSGAAQGYQVSYDATSSQNYINSLSESYEDRDWWPCKADMQDKIDSMDIIVSVPWTGADTFWVATNGKLTDSLINGSSREFTSKTRYPIASYLVAVTVARYNRYYTSVNIGGTNTQVAYYLIRGKTAATYNSIINEMDKMNQVLTVFNNKYGDYGFKNEKHGFYEGLEGACGMEHQTFSGIATDCIGSLSVLAHELAHQWFGDKVSFATWNDVWLAEGFATYSETLAAETVPALGLDPVSMRSAIKSTALATSTTPIRLSAASIVNSNAIWSNANDNAMYERGAMVLSMLRALVGDTKFFQALQNYQSDPLLAYKSATTTDLKNHFEAVTGWDMNPFFNDWVNGTGNPDYSSGNSINWGYNSGTKTFNVQVVGQSRSSGSTVGYFHTPIVLRLQGSLAAQDTTIVIYDQNGVLSYGGNGISGNITGGIIPFTVSFKPVTVTFDPFDQVIATGATNNLVSLPVKIIDFALTQDDFNNILKLTLSDEDKDLQRVELQKSTDGISFKAGVEMTKSTNAGPVKNFIYTDNDPSYPIAFYRARVIGSDGNEQFSKIIKAIARQTGRGEIFPNPANDKIIIHWTNARESKKTEISIIDINGQLIWQKTVGGNSLSVNTSAIPAGLYSVQLKQEGVIVQMSKLVLRR
ncbi:MAG: T9SS type A sorting domain-containing protein [Chitinophagaceae bacterium]|nr:T9SS type A sorting domain-containing protein [Chitinophagaceae bacterium]